MDHQLDFSKLYCQLHPYEMITNYCNDQKCLVGLCATCICSHTEMHAQMGTVPHYQNIRDTFCTLHDEVRNMVSKLEQDKCRLGSVRQSTEIKKITVRKTIRQLRQDALNKIREEFDMLEKKIIADISSEQKKQGYHSNIRFQTLEKNLSRQTETLLSYIEGLNSPNFLEWTKKLKRQALLEANQSRLKIEKQLSDNETYTANLKWNQNFLMDLETCIKKMFTIQFIVPNKGCEVKTIIPVLRQSNININMLQRSTSQPKLSQSFIRNNSSLVGLSKFAESTSMSTFFNESDKPLQMQKQSFMRKNNSIVSPSSSSVSDCEVLASKENYLARSSMINEQMQFLNRSSMMNSSMAFTKPSFQNDKLANLLQLKKSTQFDSGRNSALIREENILKDTNIHQN